MVPVLSLPIAITRHRGNGGETHGESGTMGRTEPTDLTPSAFCTGATNCREAAVPMLDSAVLPPAASASASASATFPACITAQSLPIDPSTGGVPRGRNACNPSEARGDHEGQRVTRGNDASQGPGSHANCNAVKAKERMVLVAESPGQLGIGGKVWDSAFVLCDFLAKTRASALSRDSSDCSCSIPVGNIPTEDQATIRNKSQAQISWQVEGRMEPFDVSGVLESGPNTILTTPKSVGSVCSVHGIGSEGIDKKSLGQSSTQPVQPIQPIQPIQPLLGEGEGREKGIVEGRRVLELGAGTGLVSICCALLGASAVVATDFEVCPLADRLVSVPPRD